MGPYTVAAGGKWVVRGWRERAKGRLMKRLHTHTVRQRHMHAHMHTDTHTYTLSLRHRDPRQWASLWSFKSTRGSRQLQLPIRCTELARKSCSLSLARTLLLTVSRGLSLYSSLSTLSFLLFFFSRWFYIFPPHFFSTASLPPFLSLSLSYSTNCCWSSVFCVAREIFQCALAWRTMACLSCEQQRLGDMPWITLTFQ